MKTAIFRFCQINPSFIIVLGLLNGIIPTLIFPDVSWGLHLLYVLIVSFLLIFISKRECAKFAIAGIIGLLLTCSALSPPLDDYSNSLPNKTCGGIVEVRIIDARVAGKDVKWLPLPGLVRADVLRMRYSPADKWREVSGKIFLRFPKQTSIVRFGDVLQLSGIFEKPEPSIVQGGFDFCTYLKTHGISRLFVVSEKEKIVQLATVVPLWVKGERIILTFRDKLLNSMSEGMELKYRKMLAAILFGCRQGLNYENRRQFRQSGVMHIFAISGLHVGMLALTLYLLFSWVPFRFRHLLIPCFLLVYILTTGMQASAVRAFLMISIWSLHRSALRSASPINAIFLAAVIVLLWNPLSLLGAGFQYSFIIAGFLILSWQGVKKWLTCLNEPNLWNPAYGTGAIFYLYKLRNLSLNSLCCSFIAWLASSGLNLLHRNLFIPGAVLANFIILPFVWLLFLTAAFDIVFLPLRKILYTGNMLQWLLKIIHNLSSAGAAWGGGTYLSPPPYWMLLCFFIGLFFLVTAKKQKTFLTAVIIICVNFIFWYYLPYFNQKVPEITMVYGDESQVPGFINIPSGRTGITVINAGSKNRAGNMLDFLKSNGINSIDTLCFSQNGKEVFDGAWVLFSGIDIRQAIFPREYRKSAYAKFAMQAALKSGVQIDFMTERQAGSNSEGYYKSPPFCLFRKSAESFCFSTKFPKSDILGEIKRYNTGEKEITIKTTTCTNSCLLENSNRLKFFYFPEKITKK